MAESEDRERVLDLLAYLDAGPTPYHAVRETARRLEALGFERWDERAEWRIEPGQRAFVVRGGGTLAAFITGTEPPSESGFTLIGAHTDSPNLRLKPNSDVHQAGYDQLGVEPYGGVLLSTWLDRDLSLAGRVSTTSGASYLVDLERPICRIPNLAIHLNREVNEQGLILNKQKHLAPIFAMSQEATPDPLSFRRLLAEAIGASGNTGPEDITSFDLCLYDAQRAALGGRTDAFIASGRLDNLASCHAALSAFALANAPHARTRGIILYDHEEVGSQSNAGAKSRFLEGVLERLALGYPEPNPVRQAQAKARALSRSLFVSVDMAHAVHPNYVDRHETEHQPKLGQGAVLKVNANQSYATDSIGASLFEAAWRRTANRPAQRFVVRSDLPCGSTIGPISAARLGLRTVDVGNPMLAMHSCRETSGTDDVGPMIRTLAELFDLRELPEPAS